MHGSGGIRATLEEANAHSTTTIPVHIDVYELYHLFADWYLVWTA